MELRLVFTIELAEAESRLAEFRQLEKSVHEAEEDLEALRVAHARVDELTAESASLTAGTDQAKAERDTLSARVRKLKVAVATRYREVRVVVWACGPQKVVLQLARIRRIQRRLGLAKRCPGCPNFSCRRA